MKKTLCMLLTAVLVCLLCTASVLAETELTDEELYAEIDRELHLDRERGELCFSIADDAHIDELKQALIDMGLPSEFDNPYLYTGLFEDRPDHWYYGLYTVTVPEEIIREVYFQMEHCDVIKNTFPNHIAYLDWIPPEVGDANGDYTFDALDYMFAKRAILGSLGNRGYDEDLIDVNYDGDMDMVDYMLIKRAVLGTAKLTARPALADMTDKQFAHWLDEIAPCAAPNYEMTICFRQGVTESQALEMLGTECEVLLCSTDYYPAYAMWMVVKLSEETYRTALTNVVFSDLVDAWSTGRNVSITY